MISLAESLHGIYTGDGSQYLVEELNNAKEDRD
jgi:hypothetical protein